MPSIIVHLVGFLNPPPDMAQLNFLMFGELCISGRLGVACLHLGLWFLFCKCLTASLNPSIPMSPCDLTTVRANLVSSMRSIGKHGHDFRWQKDKELF